MRLWVPSSLRGSPRRRPTGRVEIFRDGRLVSRSRNLVVTAAATAMANLAAGVTAGQYVSVAGFGSGTTAPQLTDTDLSAEPKYYNAVQGHTFPSAGEVEFTINLVAGTDYAAAGITVTEVGLFGNSAAVLMPSYVGTGIAAWGASTAYTVGQMATDSNGNVQRCTTAGTSGSAAPVWSTAIGATTTDNTVTWTMIAGHTVPSPMWAHAQVTAFDFTGSSTYTETWTIQF